MWAIAVKQVRDLTKQLADRVFQAKESAKAGLWRWEQAWAIWDHCKALNREWCVPSMFKMFYIVVTQGTQNNLIRWMPFLILLTNKNTDALRGQVSYLRPNNEKVLKFRSRCQQFDSRGKLWVTRALVATGTGHTHTCTCVHTHARGYVLMYMYLHIHKYIYTQEWRKSWETSKGEFVRHTLVLLVYVLFSLLCTC